MLLRRFLAQELLNATGVIYPQYWLVFEVETLFLGYLVIIQAHFGHPKDGGTAMVGGSLLNPICHATSP